MNKFSNRPLAPHLTVYSLQGLSLFSIWHRISAVLLMLSIIIFLLVQKSFLWLSYSFMTHNIVHFLQQVVNSYTIFFVYILVLYHTINGLRHILWDLDFFLSNKNVGKTNTSIMLFFLILQMLFYKNFFL